MKRYVVINSKGACEASYSLNLPYAKQYAIQCADRINGIVYLEEEGKQGDYLAPIYKSEIVASEVE